MILAEALFRGIEACRCLQKNTPNAPTKFDQNPTTLRAKGTLISEPRYGRSTPCEMRFFPREKREMAFVEGFSLKRPSSLSRVGKIAARRG